MGFTRNYKNLLMTTLIGDFSSSSSYGNSVPFNDSATNTFKAIDGTNYYISKSKGKSYSLSLFEPKALSGNTYDYWSLGTGTTPFNFDDYTLEQVFTNFSYNSSSIQTEIIENGNVIVTVSWDITPTENATITEIGKNSLISYASYERYGLIFREVLQEPIQLIANERKVITIKFEVPNPIQTQ